MKTKNILKTALLAMVVPAFLLNQGCSEDEITSPETTLAFHIHNKVGDETLELDKVYTVDSMTFSINLLQYYISSIYAENHEGDLIPFTDKYLLVSPENDDYELGELESGHYHGFKFDVGVDSSNNHNDPATFPSDHPLYVQVPSMNWNWAGGYKFFVIEGEVDTDSDGIPDTPFAHHIGSDALLTTIDFIDDHSYQVTTDMETEIGIDFDVKQLYTGIDLTDPANFDTHTMNNMPLAMQLRTNFANAFSVD